MHRHRHVYTQKVKKTKESILKKSLRRRKRFTKIVKKGVALYKAVWAHNVMLGPSNVSGLGVFTTKHFKKGQILCIYSGKMTAENPAGHSKFVLKGKLWNKQLQKHEDWSPSPSSSP